jgi:hypothetical protein
MNTDHHLERMSGHPVPRFEIVHKPESRVEPSASVAPNPQPWSARFIGANGEEVWRTSEPYVDVRDAERAIALLAEALGSQALFEGIKPKRDLPRPVSIAVARVEVGP